MSFRLSLNRCPVHREFMAIMLDEYDDNEQTGTGTRLTPSKCCGRWDTIKSWPLTKKQLEEIGNTFLEYAEDSE